MKHIKHLQSIRINENSREEILPDFIPEFPYISTYAELDRYPEDFAPWHWHRPVELFFIKSGQLEYTLPSGKWVFPAGSGGFINSNVLHTSSFLKQKGYNIQLLHIFDPSLISGEAGSLIEAKYILPLTASGIEIIPLFPEDPAQADILQKILDAFALDGTQWGYELRLRGILTDIWLKLLELSASERKTDKSMDGDEKIKKLMVYIHEHYQQEISIEELSKAVPVSRRTCFRLFQDNLHVTPTEYIRSYRLLKACRLLARSNESITQIACSCHLGSASYFGKTFREAYQCTPSEYRRRWHDHDTSLHKPYS